MNIVVIIRQTPDTETKIKISPDISKIDNAGITWIINPYDEFAIEKALKIKEQIGTGEVILFACGHSRTEEAIRQGLAMGADRAIFIKDDTLENADAFTVSKLIGNELKSISYDLIMTGKKTIDLESSQIPGPIAEGLGIPCLSLVMKINSIDVAGKKLECLREVDGTKETVEVVLPAMVTCDRGDDIPRYASITGIMKAKKKEIKEIAKADVENKTIIKELILPPARKEAKIFEGEISEKVAALVKALREEAKVI